MMVNHPVDPHPIIQSLLVALAGLDDIPMSYQEATIAILDNIPDTKPETPEQTQDRISKERATSPLEKQAVHPSQYKQNQEII